MPRPERTASGSYRIRFTDPWGQRTIITRATAADVKAAYRNAISAIDRGEYADPRAGRITIAEWADQWLAGARNLSRGGHDTYRRDLDRYILPELGRMRLGALTAADIDRYLNGLRLARSSQHRHYRTIRRMLEVARMRGLVPRNQAEFVQAPMVPKARRPVLDPLQVEALADHIADRYRGWVYVMCYGGLRWSESVGLRRARVHGPKVEVVEQLIHRPTGEWDRVYEPKAGSQRSLTLPDFAADELAVHMATYSLPGPDGLVFPTRNGTPVQGPSFTGNVFKRALRKAGLPDIRIHDLRRTAVSLAVDAGANPKANQIRAGHASSALHMDTYATAYPAADETIAVMLAEHRAKALRGHLKAV